MTDLMSTTEINVNGAVTEVALWEMNIVRSAGAAYDADGVSPEMLMDCLLTLIATVCVEEGNGGFTVQSDLYHCDFTLKSPEADNGKEES